MAFDFPDSPTVGQVYNGYTWDGEKWWWVPPPGTPIGGMDQATADARYVNVTGDTMTGPLVAAADPDVPLGVATKQYVDAKPVGMDQTTADGRYVNTTGDTMSGAFTINAGLTVNSNILANGDIYAVRTGGTTGVIFLGNGGHYLYYDGATYRMPAGDLAVGGCLSVSNAATVPLSFSSSSLLAGGRGYVSRTATDGSYGSNSWNFYYNAQGSTVSVIVDNNFLGTIAMNSDYRIKKDVEALPGTWETVKALRPIRYSIKDYTPPSAMVEFEKSGEHFVQNDDTECWGFLAHELQETLTKSAATGEKDMTTGLQSPNPWTIIAALTKTIQEMQTRIEALEAGL